jgi:hypothetical protein
MEYRHYGSRTEVPTYYGVVEPSSLGIIKPGWWKPAAVGSMIDLYGLINASSVSDVMIAYIRIVEINPLLMGSLYVDHQAFQTPDRLTGHGFEHFFMANQQIISQGYFTVEYGIVKPLVGSGDFSGAVYEAQGWETVPLKDELECSNIRLSVYGAEPVVDANVVSAILRAAGTAQSVNATVTSAALRAVGTSITANVISAALRAVGTPFSISANVISAALKAVGGGVACSSHSTQSECEGAGCYWYDNSCHSSPPPSNKATLVGTVRSMFGAVAGASVTMDGKSAVTLADGSFTIADLSNGSYTITIQPAGLFGFLLKPYVGDYFITYPQTYEEPFTLPLDKIKAGIVFGGMGLGVGGVVMLATRKKGEGGGGESRYR